MSDTAPTSEKLQQIKAVMAKIEEYKRAGFVDAPAYECLVAAVRGLKPRTPGELIAAGRTFRRDHRLYVVKDVDTKKWPAGHWVHYFYGVRVCVNAHAIGATKVTEDVLGLLRDFELAFQAALNTETWLLNKEAEAETQRLQKEEASRLAAERQAAVSAELDTIANELGFAAPSATASPASTKQAANGTMPSRSSDKSRIERLLADALRKNRERNSMSPEQCIHCAGRWIVSILLADAARGDSTPEENAIERQELRSLLIAAFSDADFTEEAEGLTDATFEAAEQFHAAKPKREALQPVNYMSPTNDGLPQPVISKKPIAPPTKKERPLEEIRAEIAQLVGDGTNPSLDDFRTAVQLERALKARDDEGAGERIAALEARKAAKFATDGKAGAMPPSPPKVKKQEGKAKKGGHQARAA